MHGRATKRWLFGGAAVGAVLLLVVLSVILTATVNVVTSSISVPPDGVPGAGRPVVERFIAVPNAEFNAFITLEAGTLSRHDPESDDISVAVAAACKNHSGGGCGELSVDGNDALVRRCARECIAMPDNVCTGFVIKFNDTCFFKQHPVMSVTPTTTNLSPLPPPMAYVRDPLSAPASFRLANYAMDPDFLSTRAAFGVMAAWKYRHDRLFPMLSTSLCDAAVVILLEDDAATRIQVQQMVSLRNGHRNHNGSVLPPRCLKRKRFVFAVEPVVATERSFNGAWKNLPLLREMFHTFMLKTETEIEGGVDVALSAYLPDWFIMSDDDTYVFQRNLNLFLTRHVRRHYDPRRLAFVAGELYEDHGMDFVHGGGGTVFSRVAVRRLMENYRWCMDECRQWAGDLRMGCCMRRSGVKLFIRPARHLFSPKDAWLGIEERQRVADKALFPLTFHKVVDASYFFALYAAESPLLRTLPLSGMVVGNDGGRLAGQSCPLVDVKRITEILMVESTESSLAAEPYDASSGDDTSMMAIETMLSRGAEPPLLLTWSSFMRRFLILCPRNTTSNG